MFIRGRPITMYIPSNIQNYGELKMELPSEKLELDWVYPLSVMVQGHLQNLHVYEKYPHYSIIQMKYLDLLLAMDIEDVTVGGTCTCFHQGRQCIL